jgi:hypothetical protein
MGRWAFHLFSLLASAPWTVSVSQSDAIHPREITTEKHPSFCFAPHRRAVSSRSHPSRRCRRVGPSSLALKLMVSESILTLRVLIYANMSSKKLIGTSSICVYCDVTSHPEVLQAGCGSGGTRCIHLYSYEYPKLRANLQPRPLLRYYPASQLARTSRRRIRRPAAATSGQYTMRLQREGNSFLGDQATAVAKRQPTAAARYFSNLNRLIAE